jgi:ribonuclease BN (tRNA processing enzyme)
VGVVSEASTLALTVLGCSGSYAKPGGACSGYLVQAGATSVWLDAGPGTLATLQEHVGLESVDAIILSHEHPDHWHDLEGYLVASRYGTPSRSGIPVYAPSGLRDRAYFDLEPTFDWHEVADADRVDVGALTFSFSRTDHSVETLAVRVDGGGASLGYSADSGPDWSLEALGPPLDLALCEATLSTDEEGKVQHMSARQAGVSARAAGARRLMLTHLWPTLDPGRSLMDGSDAYGATAELAVHNRRYPVTAP